MHRRTRGLKQRSDQVQLVCVVILLTTTTIFYMFVYTLLSTQVSLGFLALATANSSSGEQAVPSSQAPVSKTPLDQVGTATAMLAINVRNFISYCPDSDPRF